MKTELRAMGRAVLVAAVLVVTGCSFKDKGINTTSGTDEDAGGLAGAGATGGGGGGKGGTSGSGGAPGTGGARLDGAVSSGDGPASPPPPPPDAAMAIDLASDAPGLALGAACTTDGVCGSGFCADGVCCDQRCGDPCHSCNGMTTGAAAGLCKPDVANTACGGAMCMGSTHTPAPRCDGNGACVPRMAAPCPGNLTCASATACRTRCAADGECTGGLTCDTVAGTCRAPGKPNGQACMMGAECATGNCADGVCCDLQCTGVCRACVKAQTGKADGTCADVADHTKDARCLVQDPGTCGRDGTCDGQGRCRVYPNGTRCATECCGGGGGGGDPRVCAFECQNGACDRAHPMVLDRCGGAQCCCPTGAQGGGPACVLPLSCPLGTCVQ